MSRSARWTRSASAPSGALAEPYAELREAVKDAPVVCVDQTGWRCAGERRTLWGALTDSCAAFHSAADRHQRELPEPIGASSEEVLLLLPDTPRHGAALLGVSMPTFRRRCESLAAGGVSEGI